MKATEFDKKFDAGEDVSGAIDWSQARRPNDQPKRVNVGKIAARVLNDLKATETAKVIRQEFQTTEAIPHFPSKALISLS